MELKVDKYRCKLCGACQEVAPETFEVDEKACELTVNEDGNPDPALLEQAAAWCPAHCIEVIVDKEAGEKDGGKKN